MPDAAPHLAVDVGGGLTLRNPVIAASGTFGYGVEFAGVVDLAALGAIVVKGLSLEPSAGHPAPRLIETAAGMMNAIGLQNIGVRAFIETKLPALRRYGTPIVANCWGNVPEEFAETRVAALATPRASLRSSSTSRARTSASGGASSPPTSR